MGSNLGNRAENLRQGIDLLSSHPDLTVEAESTWYETAPYGFIEQDPFYNACLRLSSPLEALALLDFCLYVEKALGRRREGPRWGPRLLDIDIVDYGLETRRCGRLTVPHPYFHDRLFVLVPLREVALPDLLVHYSIDALIAGLERGEPGGSGLRRLKRS